MTDTSLRQMQGGAGLAASVSAAASTTVPSPLPFVVSILPLLLSSSDVTLPPALLSPSVLQRHYYLSSTPDAPSTYLQATADSSVQDAVESRREALASTWLEDVKLSAEEDILYSRTIHEEHKLVARITLNHGIEDDIALVLLVVWEIAKTPAGDESHTDNELSDPQSRTGGENFNLFDNSDRRKDTLRGVAGQGSEDAEESSWKYYDLQLPSSKSNMNKKAWSSSISGADATLAASLTSASGSTGAASKGQQAESSTAAQQLRERRRQQQEATRGLQGEEGPDLDPEDYWAGVESSGDEMGDSADEDEAVQEDNEDSYWNSYGGGASSGDKDSIIDSGHHESELEDSTLRYNANLPQDDRAHYEYAVDAHPFASGSNHVYDYSFESERGMEDTDVPDRRILVDNFESMNRASEQNSEFANDSFLNALQSSLERVSSSQSASSDEEQDTRPNGRVNGHTNDISNNARQSNGHTANGPANGQTQYRESPTFDSAIQKSIAGIWEAFLISSASGGGGKNREIAAYEFMELVRGVVDGTAE